MPEPDPPEPEPDDPDPPEPEPDDPEPEPDDPDPPEPEPDDPDPPEPEPDDPDPPEPDVGDTIVVDVGCTCDTTLPDPDPLRLASDVTDVDVEGDVVCTVMASTVEEVVGGAVDPVVMVTALVGGAVACVLGGRLTVVPATDMTIDGWVDGLGADGATVAVPVDVDVVRPAVDAVRPAVDVGRTTVVTATVGRTTVVTATVVTATVVAATVVTTDSSRSAREAVVGAGVSVRCQNPIPGRPEASPTAHPVIKNSIPVAPAATNIAGLARRTLGHLGGLTGEGIPSARELVDTVTAERAPSSDVMPGTPSSVTMPSFCRK